MLCWSNTRLAWLNHLTGQKLYALWSAHAAPATKTRSHPTFATALLSPHPLRRVHTPHVSRIAWHLQPSWPSSTSSWRMRHITPLHHKRWCCKRHPSIRMPGGLLCQSLPDNFKSPKPQSLKTVLGELIRRHHPFLIASFLSFRTCGKITSSLLILNVAVKAMNTWKAPKLEQSGFLAVSLLLSYYKSCSGHSLMAC